MPFLSGMNTDLAYVPPPDTGLDIVFADASLIVANKPSGLLSVPGAVRQRRIVLPAACSASFRRR